MFSQIIPQIRFDGLPNKGNSLDRLFQVLQSSCVVRLLRHLRYKTAKPDMPPYLANEGRITPGYKIWNSF